MTAPALSVETHPTAVAEWRERRRTLARALLAPKPRLSVSEYAELHLVLGEGSARKGPYRYAFAPYLREIADFLSDPLAGEEGVVLKSAQVGFTVGVLVAAALYFMDQDPSPVMVMQPTLDDAERFSKKKLMPIVRASRRLRRLIAEARPGDARNTILQKTAPGASLSIVGAKSPRQMRSDSIRIFLSDERSAYDRSAGQEGNPYLLGKKRTDTYDNRKILTGSTPVVDPDETERDYQNSDQRKYYVPCPHCGAMQTLRWENLRWDKEGEGPKKKHLPETAHFVCEVSGCVIEERHKAWMVDPANGAKWIAENPGHPKPGWRVWQAYSLFPKASWAHIATDWLDAQGQHDKLQIFYNTVRAESYQELGDKTNTDDLIARREVYAAEVPAGVGVLTAAVDVQGDRLELVVKGWGHREESWLIAHHRIYGDPNQDEVWKALDRLLQRKFRHESGVELQIQVTLVDASDNTDAVYAYVKPRQRRRIYAIKGHKGKARPVIVRPGKAKDSAVRLFIIGTETAKDRVFARLRIPSPQPGDPPRPGYMHFPTPQDDGADDEYLRQFGNEEVRTKTLPNGERRREFHKKGPNEALDLEVYNLAALHVLGDGVRLYLGEIARKLNARAAEVVAVAPVADESASDAPPAADPTVHETLSPDPPPAKRKRRSRGGSGWVNGFRR